jgi:hypothetical protein
MKHFLSPNLTKILLYAIYWQDEELLLFNSMHKSAGGECEFIIQSSHLSTRQQL